MIEIIGKSTEDYRTATEKRVKEFRFILTREGVRNDELADRMLERLSLVEYFLKPGGLKHHSAYVGGLFEHSYTVACLLLQYTAQNNLEWQREESPALIGLLHDLCKVEEYVWSNEEKTEFKYNKERLWTGHGERSVIMALDMLPLTEEEQLCIRWHMGAYDNSDNWNPMGRAIEKYPNILWVQQADMMAAKVLEG